MAKQEITRRLFAGSLAALPLLGQQRRSIRLGGPIFLKSEDPAELARETRRLGYSAAYCPPAKAGDTAHIRAIEAAFREAGAVISEVGAWVNMLDPDAAKRKKNLDYVTERCSLADEVGARCCVDIAGSYNPDYWYGAHPGNYSRAFFDATVENCRHVIDAVKPKRTVFTIEMMPWSIPDGPDRYLDLIHAVDRKSFGVHMDVCNAVNSPERFYNSGALIDDLFRKLGRWIASCHAKDLAWIPEYNVHFQEVVPGRGKVDYKAYLNNVSKLDAPLMLEHLKTPEEYEEGKRYILRVGSEAGLQFA